MTNRKNDPAEEVRQLLKGTPPQNILISFDGKPPQSLEEHAKRLEKQKPKNGTSTPDSAGGALFLCPFLSEKE